MNHILKYTEDIKKEDNILLISDFYKEIAKLIAEEPVPFIYERLGVRYDHFLLDEFQDTSHLQWLNLIPLVHNSLSSKKSNLIVGDGKQAIYRWRNGEVDQFVNLPNKLPDSDVIPSIGEAQQKFIEEGEVQTLKFNYRSAPDVVSFNNGLFEYLAKANSEYIQKIYKDGSQIPKNDFQGYLEFNIQEEFEEEAQQSYCLEIIQKAVSKGYQLNDICILLKTNAKGSLVAKYLSENGVKVISQDSLFVSKDIHVKFLVSLLSSITSEKNINYQKKSIEHITALNPNLDSLRMWKDVEQQDVGIRKLMRKHNYDFKASEDFHSFYEYVEHLIAAFNFDLNDNPYLQYFLEQIHQFEKKSSTNIRAFVSWFNEKGYRESVTSPAGTEAVQVMTFHKAKGLEFPIVICPYLEWDMSKLKSDVWIEDEEHNVPAYFLRPSEKTKLTKHEAIMQEEDDKNVLDHLNAIYVAFTRAEVALFVSGDSKKKKSPIKDWILPFLDSGHGLNIKNSGSYKCIGELVQKQFENEELPSSFEFKILEDKMDRSKFSLKGDHEISFEQLDDKRRYGTELHLILSKLNSESEIDEALMKSLNKGVISPVNLPKLKSDLERLFANEHFASYFSHPKYFNEKIILDDHGKMHVPDKIIFSKDEVVVIDYKSGEEQEEKYESQLQRYIELLKEMDYKNVRGEIFYTESLSVKQVLSE